MEILIVYFSRAFFTTIECRSYLADKNLVPILRVIRSDTDYVYVIQNQNNFTHHIKKNIGNGIVVKYGYF